MCTNILKKISETKSGTFFRRGGRGRVKPVLGDTKMMITNNVYKFVNKKQNCQFYRFGDLFWMIGRFFIQSATKKLIQSHLQVLDVNVLHLEVASG